MIFEPHATVQDCDCRECAIAERDRLKEQNALLMDLYRTARKIGYPMVTKDALAVVIDLQDAIDAVDKLKENTTNQEIKS